MLIAARQRREHRQLELDAAGLDEGRLGDPCPRIFSEPARAINPTTRPPTTGARSASSELS
jgi:hypothetical protein